MKKILFATLATIAASASAADTVLVTAELTRNGELVDEFSGYTINGSTHPYRNVQLIRYNKAITNNKVKWGELEVGTTGTITPVVTSDGKIRVSFYMNYVRLVKMNSSKVGGLQVDLPQTDGYKVSSTLAMPSGGTGEYKSSENGVEYIYKVSATKQ